MIDNLTRRRRGTPVEGHLALGGGAPTEPGGNDLLGFGAGIVGIGIDKW